MYQAKKNTNLSWLIFVRCVHRIKKAICQQWKNQLGFQSDSLALPFIKGQGWRYIHQGKSGLHFKKYLGIPQQNTSLLLMTMNIKTDINTKKSLNLNIKLAMASLWMEGLDNSSTTLMITKKSTISKTTTTNINNNKTGNGSDGQQIWCDRRGRLLDSSSAI